MLAADIPQSALCPQDLTVMVCCYGFAVATAASMLDRLQSDAVPLLNLSGFDLPASFDRLQKGGWLNEQGLSETGLAYLSASKYWMYAESLKGQASSYIPL